MIALTSTPEAPWTLVESTQKRFSRLKVLETLVDRLEQAL
jgi:polyphosphate kinase 2 (PPK2 family)